MTIRKEITIKMILIYDILWVLQTTYLSCQRGVLRRYVLDNAFSWALTTFPSKTYIRNSFVIVVSPILN